MRRVEKTQGPDYNEVQESIGEYVDLRETAKIRAEIIQDILDR